MKRLWMSGAAAVMAMSISGLGAQTPQQPPTQPPTTQPPATQTPATATAPTQSMASTTIQGCVYKEQDIPGRSPNIAEKAGVLEDYILVASTDAASATAGTSRTTPPATAGTSGTAATGMSAHKAFKLENIADEQLRAVVGKRVEVTGRVDADRGDSAATPTATGTAGAPARDNSMGPDQIELPEFEVTSMREVAGTCPATPTIRK
ncbi:MAG: hypothetical protein H0W53_21345 [Acidobacteria bacterium]|nr:hypothetical protein [Acidobacteriota bacterium]